MTDKLLWTSSNKKWEIRDCELKHKTDWADKWSTVAMVSASDGWGVAYASIDACGAIHVGDYMTKWEYFVPTTISDKAYALLRKLYQARKPTTSSKQMPLQYILIIYGPRDKKTGMRSSHRTLYYRTYETALKHAKEELAKFSKKDFENGAFINLGRFGTDGMGKYYSPKEVPETYRYNLMDTFNAENPVHKAKW